MARPGKQADPGQGEPARILVVNDDEDAGELVVRILAHAGYAVARVTSPDDAVARAADDPPSCVVLDLSSGVGGSLKLLDTLRSHPDPRIAETGAVLVAKQASNRLFSWQSGVDAFIVRPFHVDELLDEVDAVLGRSADERIRHRKEQQAKAAGP